MRQPFLLVVVGLIALGAGYFMFLTIRSPIDSQAASEDAPASDAILDARRGHNVLPGHEPVGQPPLPSPTDLSLVDEASPSERNWAARNLAFSHRFLEDLRPVKLPIESINPKDGFSIEEIASSYEWAADIGVSTEDRSRARALLTEAATLGSIGALSALGSLHSSGIDRNPIEAEAYFRLSEMRGDWSASLRQGTTGLLYQLDARESTLASLRAHELLAQINETRYLRGQPPLGVDPRPGLANAMRTIRQNQEANPGKP